VSALKAVRRYARAERALAENYIDEYEAGISGETFVFLVLNREAWEARQAMRRWLGWLKGPLWRWAVRGLDYWHRTGQS
jgi:hypothetical protein